MMIINCVGFGMRQRVVACNSGNTSPQTKAHRITDKSKSNFIQGQDFACIQTGSGRNVS